MTHTYSVSGMTCSGCANTVKKALEVVPNVDEVQIDLAKGVKDKHLIATKETNQMLGNKYPMRPMNRENCSFCESDP